jgi:hypothetical protein
LRARRPRPVASRCRAIRRNTAIIAYVLAGISAGTATWLYLDSHSSTAPARDSFGPLFLTFAFVDALAATYLITTPGSVESAFHAYQTGSPRARTSVERALGCLRLGAARQGAFAGFGGTF